MASTVTIVVIEQLSSTVVVASLTLPHTFALRVETLAGSFSVVGYCHERFGGVKVLGRYEEMPSSGKLRKLLAQHSLGSVAVLRIVAKKGCRFARAAGRLPVSEPQARG